jgi:toxin ParE1/3/4
MPRLRYSAEAKEDLKQIAEYIAHDKPIAARKWAAKLREKCRLVARQPGVGDDRPELGDGIRSSYLGSYVIFFRRTDCLVEIVRIIRGDRET